MALPALARAKQCGQSIRCRNNLWQMGLSWLMYAHDNDDRIPPNAEARLFRFEQLTGEVGRFVDAGAATVSADGSQIETAAIAITQTSYYFVSIRRPTAAINGRVVESSGRPVPQAIVQARGQTTFTDGNGGFVLRDVPVLKAGDRVRVDCSVCQASGLPGYERESSYP